MDNGWKGRFNVMERPCKKLVSVIIYILAAINSCSLTNNNWPIEFEIQLHWGN